jgi:hypothetical protein
MPTSSTISEQDGIPGEQSSAVVREYSLETAREIKADFLHGAEGLCREIDAADVRRLPKTENAHGLRRTLDVGVDLAIRQ